MNKGKIISGRGAGYPETLGEAGTFQTPTKKLDYSSIETQIKFLQGKVLTIIDASYTNERQLKAVKDLVNKMFGEQLSWIGEICFPELPIKSKEHVGEILGVKGDEIVENVIGVM